jgi:holo-[acyl-carrier protein] synthase
MIIGVGVDIVSVERIERLHRRYGERFSTRILAPGEQARLATGVPVAPFLAKRFAAKEALSKALGTGFSDGVRFADIEVFNDPRGRPGIRLTGAADQRARELGVAAIHVSLADERQYAVAQVVLVGA